MAFGQDVIFAEFRVRMRTAILITASNFLIRKTLPANPEIYFRKSGNLRKWERKIREFMQICGFALYVGKDLLLLREIKDLLNLSLIIFDQLKK